MLRGSGASQKAEAAVLLATGFSHGGVLVMRNFRVLVLGLTFISFAGASQASAAAMFSLFAEGNYGLTSFAVSGPGGTGSDEGAIGYGGGFLMELGLGKSAGFELGASYKIANRTTTVNGTSETTDSSSIWAPVGIRFHSGPKFSFVLGGFIDYSLKSGTGDAMSLGLSGGFRLGHKVFFEPRFNYFIESVTIGTETKKRMEAMLLIGLSLGK